MTITCQLICTGCFDVFICRIYKLTWWQQTCIGDLNHVLEGPRQNATLLSLKGFCSYTWRHLYIVKLQTVHIHFQPDSSSPPAFEVCITPGDWTQGREYAGRSRPLNSLSSPPPILVYLQTIKNTTFLYFTWSKARVNKQRKHYCYYQTTVDTRSYKKTHRSEIQNLFIERICKNTNKRKLILRTTILKIKPI